MADQTRSAAVPLESSEGFPEGGAPCRILSKKDFESCYLGTHAFQSCSIKFSLKEQEESTVQGRSHSYNTVEEAEGDRTSGERSVYSQGVPVRLKSREQTRKGRSSRPPSLGPTHQCEKRGPVRSSLRRSSRFSSKVGRSPSYASKRCGSSVTTRNNSCASRGLSPRRHRLPCRSTQKLRNCVAAARRSEDAWLNMIEELEQKRREVLTLRRELNTTKVRLRYREKRWGPAASSIDVESDCLCLCQMQEGGPHRLHCGSSLKAGHSVSLVHHENDGEVVCALREAQKMSEYYKERVDFLEDKLNLSLQQVQVLKGDARVRKAKELRLALRATEDELRRIRLEDRSGRRTRSRSHLHSHIESPIAKLDRPSSVFGEAVCCEIFDRPATQGSHSSPSCYPTPLGPSEGSERQHSQDVGSRTMKLEEAPPAAVQEHPATPSAAHIDESSIQLAAAKEHVRQLSEDLQQARAQCLRESSQLEEAQQEVQRLREEVAPLRRLLPQLAQAQNELNQQRIMLEAVHKSLEKEKISHSEAEEQLRNELTLLMSQESRFNAVLREQEEDVFKARALAERNGKRELQLAEAMHRNVLERQKSLAADRELSLLTRNRELASEVHQLREQLEEQAAERTVEREAAAARYDEIVQQLSEWMLRAQTSERSPTVRPTASIQEIQPAIVTSKADNVTEKPAETTAAHSSSSSSSSSDTTATSSNSGSNLAARASALIAQAEATAEKEKEKVNSVLSSSRSSRRSSNAKDSQTIKPSSDPPVPIESTNSESLSDSYESSFESGESSVNSSSARSASSTHLLDETVPAEPPVAPLTEPESLPADVPPTPLADTALLAAEKPIHSESNSSSQSEAAEEEEELVEVTLAVEQEQLPTDVPVVAAAVDLPQSQPEAAEEEEELVEVTLAVEQEQLPTDVPVVAAAVDFPQSQSEGAEGETEANEITLSTEDPHPVSRTVSGIITAMTFKSNDETPLSSLKGQALGARLEALKKSGQRIDGTPGSSSVLPLPVIMSTETSVVHSGPIIPVTETKPANEEVEESSVLSSLNF